MDPRAEPERVERASLPSGPGAMAHAFALRPVVWQGVISRSGVSA